jgi:L-lactate dehydrogenase complex protein LldG
MTARENILGRVRTALRRTSGTTPDGVPSVRLRVPDVPMTERIEQFCGALEKLAAKAHVARGHRAVGDYVREVTGDRTVASTGADILNECGLIYPPAPMDEAAVGLTGAEYGLADTGTLVVMSAVEARLASLLPPMHIAVIESSRILSGLDELLTLVPEPAAITASMVLITGPSRTADIEQILVRGVHGPGELHVVIVV